MSSTLALACLDHVPVAVLDAHTARNALHAGILDRALVSSLIAGRAKQKTATDKQSVKRRLLHVASPFAAQARRHGALAPEFISLLEHAFETSLVELLWSTKVNLWKSWSPFPTAAQGSRFLCSATMRANSPPAALSCAGVPCSANHHP